MDAQYDEFGNYVGPQLMAGSDDERMVGSGGGGARGLRVGAGGRGLGP